MPKAQIVTNLELLGFEVAVNVHRNSPTVTSIIFSNAAVAQSFNVVISDSALAVLTTYGFFEDALNAGIELPTEEFATLMNIVPPIIAGVINSPDATVSLNFAAAAGSVATTIRNLFPIIVNVCFEIPECEVALSEFLQSLIDKGIDTSFDVTVPKLIVIKEVTNDNGGILVPADFTIHVNKDSRIIVSFSGKSESEGGKEIRLGTGKYNVTEDTVDGYNSSFSLACQDEIEIGQTKTCIITNDDVPPLPPPTETICDDRIDNDGDGAIDSADPDCPPPPPLFSENFDGDVSRWPKTCSGCTELRRSAAGPHGEEPPSHPNWGFVGQSFSSPFCTNDLQGRMTNTFFVPTEGDYMVSGVVGGGVCDVCTMTGRVIVSDVVVLEGRGTNLSTGITRHPEFKENTIHLTRGTHFIGLEMHSTFACNGFFYGVFDDIKIEGPISTPLVSSLADMNGGPYFDVQIDQTSVNVSRPDTVTIPLQVNWSDGYEAEPVNVSVIGLNGTGITHSVSSITDSQFEVVFEIPSGVEIGEYQFLISVREAESDDVVGTGITFNVE